MIGLTGNKIREDVIVRNWPDILRVAATLASGALPPSQLLRKFGHLGKGLPKLFHYSVQLAVDLAAYPRQHELAVTLREIGRVERTLFIRTLCIVDWLLDADMQRRANTGLNKGLDQVIHPTGGARLITRSRTRSGSDARAKSATTRARASTAAWPGSTCSQSSSFTGIPPISAKRSDSGNTPG